MKMNLNLQKISYDWSSEGKPLSEYARKNAASDSGEIQVFFTDIEDRLVEAIEAADAVVGCVAWLTNKRVLQALAQKDNVQIVVQKEDFLRPDMFALPDYKREIRQLYDQLEFNDRYYLKVGFAVQLNIQTPYIEPVRCAGNYNRDKSPAFPRMHHKFIVLCEEQGEGENMELCPYAVWTGSFNFTYNAGHSLENALIIRNPEIVKAYAHEYSYILGLSEPLDWESDWVAPEYRIGT